MRTQEKSKRTSTTMALALGLLMTLVPAPVKAASPTVAVVGTSVSGSTVYVTVKNYSLLPQLKTVSVQAVVNGTSTWVSVPVSLLSYQTTTVSAGFCSVVSTVGTISLTDDPSPM